MSQEPRFSMSDVNPPAPHRSSPALVLAAAMALLGWSALATDFSAALSQSLARGHGITYSVLTYVRFFTIQSNGGLAVLMSATVLALLRRRRLPPANVFRAALAYMAVTCVTYELLLRGTWSPHGVQFLTDLAFHDLQPALTLLFWLAFAPKRELEWRNLPWLLVYPALYLAVTLAAGALGAGYPYDFLNPDIFGTRGLAAIAAAFLVVFLALGGLATLVGRSRRTAADGLRPGPPVSRLAGDRRG